MRPPSPDREVDSRALVVAVLWTIAVDIAIVLAVGLLVGGCS